jgi:hypothetical protein
MICGIRRFSPDGYHYDCFGNIKVELKLDADEGLILYYKCDKCGNDKYQTLATRIKDLLDKHYPDPIPRF